MENGLEISLLSTQYECSSEIQAEKGVCFLRSIAQDILYIIYGYPQGIAIFFQTCFYMNQGFV